ncbi:MAG: riboflavin biosynthesis protein RibF [Opitutaceae bacterium]|jgi:riboflavin kinase/FMN adenylyltransferase|nr:riboflavin biosynthesis protein RibF [Opitutaceae bacterium]
MAAPLQFHDLAETRLPARPLHHAIGMFDGVHLGHRAVIDAAIQSARRGGGLAGVLTFWPHPGVLVRPDSPVPLINDPGLKARLLAAAGMDFIITQRFTPGFAAIEAVDFLPLLQQNLPSLSAIYVGENWRYGHGRGGDIHSLVEAARARGLAVVSSQRINLNGEPISSTRIRACLAEGRLDEANALLGYSYFAEGLVAAGKALGRAIGFPTLNLSWTPGLRPRFGVYAVQVTGPKSADRHPGVANYGLRPTVEPNAAPRLEAHLFGPCPFAAGDKIQVDWLRFLRPEMKFPGIKELAARIAEDRAQAETFFKTAPAPAK